MSRDFLGMDVIGDVVSSRLAVVQGQEWDLAGKSPLTGSFLVEKVV